MNSLQLDESLLYNECEDFQEVSEEEDLMKLNLGAAKKLTHVIFDLDGTIFNSEVIYKKIYNIIAYKYGRFVPNSLIPKLKGISDKDGIEMIISELELPLNFQEYHKLLRKLIDSELVRVDPMPGAARLITHLHKNNIPLAIATSSKMNVVNLLFKNQQKLRKCFSHIVAVDDAQLKKPKPAPDIFLLAATRFKPKALPSNCLVFEDSTAGVKSAIAAGMTVVYVSEGYEAGEPPECDDHIRTLNEFSLEHYGLPSY